MILITAITHQYKINTMQCALPILLDNTYSLSFTNAK